MAGLVPAIHVLAAREKDVDARVKTGHDGGASVAPLLRRALGGLFEFLLHAVAFEL